MKKLCKGCGDEKSLDEYAKQPAGYLGHTSRCKQCERDRGVERRKADPEKMREQSRRSAAKPENRARRKVYSKEYKRANKDEIKISNAEYYVNNKKRINAYNSNWKSTNKNMVNKASREWGQKHPDRIAEKAAKRRACKNRATPRWYNKTEVLQIYAKAKQLTAAGIETHVDHIVPIRGELVCGLHCTDNLQLLSPTENLIKGNRHG